MLEAMQRLAPFSHRIHHLGQTVCPTPGRTEGLKLFPASRDVSPYFETAWIPVVAQKICSPLSAIEFEGRTPVALNAMTGDQ